MRHMKYISFAIEVCSGSLKVAYVVSIYKKDN